MSERSFKIPESVLVVMYTPGLDVLLIERADSRGFWQSVTGSKDHVDEPWAETARREVLEETGIDAHAADHALTDWLLENVYEIYPRWRHRYAPGVALNTERLFGLALPQRLSVVLNPREHLRSQWLPWQDAAQRCTSASNAEAILQLPRMVGTPRVA
jgi:dATP pyrophosphohydrolase